MNRLKLGVAGMIWTVLAVSPWLATPAQAQTDVTGPWIVTVDTPQGRNDVDVTFKQDGKKLSGQVTSPLGSVEFSGTLIKTDLVVTYAIPVQGQTLDIKMTGVVDKDTMSGQLDLGGLGQVPWSAKRKPPTEAANSAAAPASAAPAAAASAGSLTDVSGKWNVTVMMGTNPIPLTASLKQTDGAVSGTINSPLGEMPVSGTMTGSSLTLQFTAQTPQGDMAVTMTGELGPDGLAGKSSVPGLGEAEWSAKRIE
jgi:hypothetical protein